MNYMVFEKNDILAKRIKGVINTIHKDDYYEVSCYPKICTSVFKTSGDQDLRNIIIINIDDINDNEYNYLKSKTLNLKPNIIIYGDRNKFNLDKMVDFYNMNIIIKDKNFLYNLHKILTSIFNMHYDNRFFSFAYNDEIFNIPYNSIYYIEKNINDNSINIYTHSNTYTCYKTIKKTFEELNDDSRFIKTSRSSIINIQKIYYYDKCLNEVCLFNGMKTYLVCRSMKRELSNRLLYSKNNVKISN